MLTPPLVTGGAGGLGIVLAAALLEAGAHVYCVDIMPDPSQDASCTSSYDPIQLTVGNRNGKCSWRKQMLLM